MNMAGKFLIGLALATGLIGGLGCEELPEVTVIFGGDTGTPPRDVGGGGGNTPDTGAPGGDQGTGGGNGSGTTDTGNPGGGNGTGDPGGGNGNDTGGNDAAAQLQQQLSGKRLTFLTSSGNGDTYSSFREDIDLCSSGEFALRSVDQFAGFGTSSEDIFESIGTWNIQEINGQLIVEMSTLQSTNGYAGTDQYALQVSSASEILVGQARYFITSDNTTCD